MTIEKNEREGQILRVKQGYNPNSSSVGSHIPVFLAFAAGAGVISVFVTNILGAVSRKIRKNKDNLGGKDEE